MYTLDSTHGLRTSAHTLRQTIAILQHHLTRHREDGQIDWLIIAPDGRKFSGCVDVSTADEHDTHDFIVEQMQRICDHIGSGLTNRLAVDN